MEEKEGGGEKSARVQNKKHHRMIGHDANRSRDLNKIRAILHKRLNRTSSHENINHTEISALFYLKNMIKNGQKDDFFDPAEALNLKSPSGYF